MVPGVILFVCNRIYRDGLREILAARREFGNVQDCRDAAMLPALAASGRPLVFVVDVSPISTEAGKINHIAIVHEFADGGPVIALGLDGDGVEVLTSVEAGAAAFVTRDDSIDSLARAIHAAALERLVARSLDRSRTSRLDRLSPRDRNIVRLLSEDPSNKQIAHKLELELSTIKNDVHNIIIKLNVQNRMIQAAAFSHDMQFSDSP